jgi:hypothetical protein
MSPSAGGPAVVKADGLLVVEDRDDLELPADGVD